MPAPPVADVAVSGQQAGVVRVIDGDTIVVAVGGTEERVRFGRLRRIVRLTDGTNLNDLLVQSGHAVIFG